MPESVLSRCLVTGASSPLGSAVTRLLVARRCKVAAMVRNASSVPRLADVRAEIDIIEGDLATPERAVAQINRFAPETVFHLAWEHSARDARNHASQIDINVTGSLHLLAAVLHAGVKCWIGLGSQAEYGPYNGVLREDLPTAPETAYGLAKLCVGKLALARCKMAGVQAVWLRLLATYGPSDVDGRLIPYLIGTLLDGGTPRISAGTQAWDYLYVDDAAEGIVAAASCECSGVFNLASGSAWTVGRIARFLRDEINPAAQLEFGSAVSSGLEADISRIVQATGWRPRTQLQDGLRQTIAWYRAARLTNTGTAATAREVVRC